MDQWEDKIRQWQKNLKQACQPSSMLSSEEVAKYEDMFTEMESPDLPLKLISDSKLTALLGFVASAAGVHTEFLFKARAAVLIKKWRRLEAATASDQFPPSRGPVVPISNDVLMYIMQSYVGDASMNDGRKEWRKKVNFLLDCALVSRDWNAAAMNLLYRGPIILNSAESAMLLLRTIENGSETPPPIQQLRLEYKNFFSLKEYGKHAGLIIGRSAELRYLDVDPPLRFAPEASLPMFGKLHELRLAGQTLRLIAPLLHKLPNLKILCIFCIEVKTPRVGVKLSGTPPVGDPVDDIPSPTFMLRELRLCQCEFASEQCQWLFSSSTAIDYVELQELYDGAEGLARVIGPYVKALHIKGMLDNFQQGDRRLVAVIPMFTALASLQVSGRDWDWAALLANIKSSLEAIAVSYSKPGCENLVRVLSDASWQPSLRVVSVHHWAGTDYFYGVKQTDLCDVKSILGDACARRNISLKWITEGGVQDSSFCGPTEADLRM